jgi:signal peptidase I
MTPDSGTDSDAHTDSNTHTNQDAGSGRVPFSGESVATFISGLSIAIIVVIAVGSALMVAGYRPVVILSGSMGRAAPPGSVVIAGPTAADEVAVGDVLVMQRPGATAVTHRVIEIEESARFRFAITKGDANELADAAPYPLDGTQLVGRWVIPRLGGWWLAAFQRTPVMTVVGAALLYLVVTALRRIWARPRGPSNDGGNDADGDGNGDPPAGIDEEPDRQPDEPPEAAHRRPPKSTVVFVVPAVIALLVGTALALSQSQEAVPTNLFETKPCFDPQLTSVQRGEAVHTVNGTVSVPITSVDAAASFVTASVRSDGADAADASVAVALDVGGASLDLTRVTDAPSPPSVTVSWSVVEYGCGIAVQRGTASGDGTSQLDINVSAVDVASSFVLVTSAAQASATDFDGDDLFIAELTGPTNLRIRSAGAAFDAGRSFAWQIVTFDDPADAVVQSISTTLTAAQGSTSLSLPSAVDVDSTFLLTSVASNSTGADIGERMVRAHLVDSTTISLDRSVAGDAVDVSVQVVQLGDGSTVRHGTVDLTAAQSSETVNIDPVDTGRATALSTVAVPGLLAGGMTDYVADDVAGEASATFTVTDPSTITVTRQASLSAASFGWQVIEWAGPGWWDGGYDFRQRIEVTAGSVAAPGGYSIPVTFDHAALATLGLSQVGGDDVRVVRWDGSAWTELDRVLDDDSTWNQTDTTVWFRTADAIAVDATDTYWLYFGNGSASAPPADPEAVYLLTEDFESATMGDFVDRTGGTGWYQADAWTRRIPITIGSGTVSADLTDYPLLVSVTSADLAANAQSDGSDIRFTAADGTTPLAHEIEWFDSGTGALTAWVSVPTVTAGADTDLYLYYGAADSPDRQDVRATWPDVTAAVWHLSRDPSLTAPQLDDSSINNRDGLSGGSMSTADLVSAQVGRAVDFDGVDDVLIASAFDPAPTGALSASALVNLDSYGDARIVAKADDGSTAIFELSVTGTGAVRAALSLDASTVSVEAGTVPLGAWHHVAFSWDGATIRLYLDGAEIGSVAAIGSLDIDGDMPVTIGNVITGDRPFDGRIDEVRVETVARSAAWLDAVSSNLGSPGTFYSAGAAQTGSWLGQGTWTFRKPLVIDPDLVPGDLSDYPLLVDLIDAEIGTNAVSDGRDIVFTAADGTTRLDHALEFFDGPSGALTAWIRVPTLSSTTNNTVFVYFGNSLADLQDDPPAVFGPGADTALGGS